MPLRIVQEPYHLTDNDISELKKFLDLSHVNYNEKSDLPSQVETCLQDIFKEVEQFRFFNYNQVVETILGAQYPQDSTNVIRTLWVMAEVWGRRPDIKEGEELTLPDIILNALFRNGRHALVANFSLTPNNVFRVLEVFDPLKDTSENQESNKPKEKIEMSVKSTPQNITVIRGDRQTGKTLRALTRAAHELCQGGKVLYGSPVQGVTDVNADRLMAFVGIGFDNQLGRLTTRDSMGVEETLRASYASGDPYTLLIFDEATDMQEKGILEVVKGYPKLDVIIIQR